MKDLFACLAGVGAVVVASLAEGRLAYRDEEAKAIARAPLTLRNAAVALAPFLVLVPLNVLIGHHVANLALKE